MLRGLVSIIALIIIVASLVVLIPLYFLPNTSLHTLIPYLAPLHQALACNEGETIAYDLQTNVNLSLETHYLCVDARGNERDVDQALLQPANYAMGTLCLGGLLMLAPLLIAVRKGVRGETGPELQTALRQSFSAAREGFAQMRQAGAAPQAQDTSLKGQLEALELRRQQGLIRQSDYEVEKQNILNSFGMK
jgi:hypothetical protein